MVTLSDAAVFPFRGAANIKEERIRSDLKIKSKLFTRLNYSLRKSSCGGSGSSPMAGDIVSARLRG